MQYLLAHWSDILAAVGALVTAASLVVKMTPTQVDDSILAKVVKVLDYLSIVNPRGAIVVTPPRAF